MASYMASIAFAVLFAVLFTIAMSLLFYCWIYVHSTQSELKDLTARILASSMSAGQTFGASATEISDQERPLVSSFRRASAVNLQASFQRHVPRNAACATVKSFEEASGNFGFASSPSPYLRSEGKHGAHPQGSREVLSERIRRVLRKYAPVRLRELPSLMQQYDGRLDALLYELVGHYGPEPHETEARAVRRALFHREAFVLRLQQFFMERCIDRASDFEWMHHACDEYSGREHVLWSILTEKYGDELPPMVPRWTVFERNIIALWVRYDPLSIDTVHFSTIVKETAERWKTNVSELFQVLGRKYKIPVDVVKKYTQATRSSRVLPIEPAPSVACSYPLERSEGDKAAHERTDCVVSMTPHNQYLNPAPSGKRRVQNENENDTVSQIRRMYAWYCPQYLPDIEFDLEEHHTRSVEFLHKLVLLYGPVPSRTLDDGSTSLHPDFSMATLNPNGSQKQPAHTAHDEIGLSDTFDTFHFDDVHSANKNIRGELPVSNCFAIAHRDWIIPAPGRSSEPALRKDCFMDVRPSIRPIPRDNSTRAGSRSQSEWNSDTEEDDAREWDDIWTCSVVQWPGPSSRARRFKKKWIHIPKLNDFNTHGQSETHDLENTLLRTSSTLTLKEVGDGVQQKKASSKRIAFVIRLETEDLVLSDYLPVYYGEGPEFWDLLCERCAELGADSLSHNSSSDRVENMITVQIRPPKSLSQDSRGTSKVAALPPVTVTDAFFRWFLSFWQNAANEHFRTRTIQYPLWLSTPTREKPENSKKKNHPALPEVGSQPPAPPTAYQWTQTVQLEVIPNRNTSSRDDNPRKTQQPLQNVYEFPLLFQIRLYDEWMRYSRSARITIRHISLKPRDPAEYRANKVSKAPRSEEELASHWLSVAEQKQVASAHTWGQVLYRWMKEAGKA